MIWNAFKTIITSVCLLFATIIIVFSPSDFSAIAFACFIVCIGATPWIDFTKQLSAQTLSPTQRKLAKVAIWALAIFFGIMFVYSIFTGEVHLNSRGFVQLIAELLKAL